MRPVPGPVTQDTGIPPARTRPPGASGNRAAPCSVAACAGSAAVANGACKSWGGGLVGHRHPYIVLIFSCDVSIPPDLAKEHFSSLTQGFISSLKSR